MRLVHSLLCLHQMIGGMTLQGTNSDRLVFCGLPHASLLTKRFCRANPGAHAAENILIKNGFGGTTGVAGLNLPDKQRYIDTGGAGSHTGGIVAKIATIRLNGRFMRV